MTDTNKLFYFFISYQVKHSCFKCNAVILAAKIAWLSMRVVRQRGKGDFPKFKVT